MKLSPLLFPPRPSPTLRRQGNGRAAGGDVRPRGRRGALPGPADWEAQARGHLRGDHGGDGSAVLPQGPDGKPHLLARVLEAQHVWRQRGLRHRQHCVPAEAGVQQRAGPLSRGLLPRVRREGARLRHHQLQHVSLRRQQHQPYSHSKRKDYWAINCVTFSNFVRLCFFFCF